MTATIFRARAISTLVLALALAAPAGRAALAQSGKGQVRSDQAKTEPTRTESARPEKAETPPRYASAKSPAGLSFYWRPDTSTPYAAINFGLRDTWAFTTAGKEGLTSFGSALIMQGPDGGQNEFLEKLRDLTGSASISIGAFTTTGSVRAPPSTVAATMELLSSALKEGKATEKYLARLKFRAEGSEAQAVTRAETIAERAALRLALGGDHPITRQFDPSRFSRVSVDDIAAWRSAVLARSQLRIAAAGRITQEEAGRLIDEAFAKLPVTAPPHKYMWPPIEVPAATVVVEHETTQSAVYMLGLTSVSGGREVEIANVANAILGGGSNGRLWEAARAGLGATYGASSGFATVSPGRRLITMRAAVANDQVKAAVETLQSAYRTWFEKGVTAGEIAATTSRFSSDFATAMDDPSRANGLVVSMLMSGRAVDELYGYESRLKTIGRESLAKFIAAKFPRAEKLLVVVVTPKADGLGAKCVVKSLADVDTCKLD